MRSIRPAALAVALLLATQAQAAPAPSWLAAWATSQQAVEPQNAFAPGELNGSTLRQTLRLTASGPTLRLRVSNAHGDGPLKLAGVHVAVPVAPGSDAIAAGSDRALTFAGRPEVIIPQGADYLSDPFPAPAGRDLAVSIYVLQAANRQNGHPGSRTTTHLLAGDHLAAPSLPGAKKVDRWWFIAGVEAAARGSAVVALGDSITDGRGSTTNGNDRWPDQLAQRLAGDRRTRNIAVLNAGIGGNRLLNDGLGPNALARFDREVLLPPGVRTVIVLEGINDIGTLSSAERRASDAEHQDLVRRMIAAYEQMIERGHSHGVRVIGATLLPFGGSDYDKKDPLNERTRQQVNAWIRTSGRFDAVVDFDAATRDPAQPSRLKAEYDVGDHLHPSPAGYKAMADAIPLTLLSGR